MSGLVLTLDAPLPHQMVIGEGTFQVLEGGLNRPIDSGCALDIKVMVDDDPVLVDQSLELFPYTDQACRFHARIKWIPEWVGKTIRLVAVIQSDGAREEQPLGKMKLVDSSATPVPALTWPGDEPMVTICMATYNPPAEPFRRQIETILMQTHNNWLLLVVDDGSDSEHWEQMRKICAADTQRIRLFKHDQNQGFYHNFERALGYVPTESDLVAFADQDDLWYPDKLAKLIEAIDKNQADLAYSDMRIVKESGEVISDTYWHGRKNEYEDMTTVFLANTVTGAASLFRRELLDQLLPFPARIGDAFHDHWLALVAMQSGKLAYVDAPLYDYYQYGDSVIGHCDFVRWSMAARFKSVFKIGLRFLNPRKAKLWLGQKIGGGLAIYRGECLRLSLFTDTLKLRFGLQNLPAAHTLSLTEGGVCSFYRLMKAHIIILRTGKTTDDAEFRLGLAYLAREYERRKA